MNNKLLLIYSIIVRIIPETSFHALKVLMLRVCGAKIGSNVRVCSSARFLGCGSLEVGDDVWIGPCCFIYPSKGSCIKIGNCVDIAPCVKLFTGSHEIGLGCHSAGKGFCRDVIVGDGCWLGAGSMVLPGVALPRKTVVAAGAVVTKSTKSNFTLLAGVPAVTKKNYSK